MEGFHRRAGALWADDVPLAELAARWGTPLYVYAASVIRSRYRAIADAFADTRPLIAYAVKANANLALLRLVRALGGGVDVVSEGELYRARLAGFPPETIVFSGVGKTRDELVQALTTGVYAANAESADEVAELARLARAAGTRPRVGLRINPMVEPHTGHAYIRTAGSESKFGLPWAQARELFRRYRDCPDLHLAGLHVHLGSQILDLEAFDLAAQAIARWIDELRGERLQLEYVDLGGGLGVRYRDDEPEPHPSELAAIVRRHLPVGELRLILEPGRYIVAPAGVLLTRVLYVKENGARKFVIVDAGMNDLLRPSHYESYHRIELVEDGERPRECVDVVGPVCESGDFLARARSLPAVRPGDLLAVMTVGAYGFVMSSNYNQRRRPAEILVDGSEARLVRRRESLDDLVAAETDLEG